MGLNPDSQEDEAGIKKAADNSEFNVLMLVHNGRDVLTVYISRMVSALKDKAYSIFLLLTTKPNSVL